MQLASFNSRSSTPICDLRLHDTDLCNTNKALRTNTSLNNKATTPLRLSHMQRSHRPILPLDTRGLRCTTSIQPCCRRTTSSIPWSTCTSNTSTYGSHCWIGRPPLRPYLEPRHLMKRTG